MVRLPIRMRARSPLRGGHQEIDAGKYPAVQVHISKLVFSTTLRALGKVGPRVIVISLALSSILVTCPVSGRLSKRRRRQGQCQYHERGNHVAHGWSAFAM